MGELPKHGVGIHRVEYETKKDGSVEIIKVEFERAEKEKHFYGFTVVSSDTKEEENNGD